MVHLPVMLDEVQKQLAIRPDGYYLDCTFGRGGHSTAILKQLGTAGRLLALDRDREAIHSEAADLLSKDPRFELQQGCFSALAQVVDNVGVLDGILMDLGVSSPQLDNAERGFSFLRDGPLDMRMDNTIGQSAEQWLATVSEPHLVKVLFEYGEERFARRIAAGVIAGRLVNPITTTRQLAKLIENIIPYKELHKHPATRTFQAIRIEINQELEELKTALGQAVQVLKPGGRLVVIAFHSLEDRLVKRFINNEAGAKYNPGKLPIKEVDIRKGDLKKVGKAIKASAEETRHNLRARSAIMRVAEKL
ncbi:MAG: 16S rRNA (cytosine(1402)-N(4))-methyltransferase RsmH [Methylococcales bacterium]